MITAMRKLCVLQIILASFLATQAPAGSLTVVGDCTVASNLTIKTAIVGISNAFTWGQYDPMDIGYGIYVHRTNDAYLTTTEGWGNRAALLAYANANKTVTELGFNPDGGQVSVGMMDGTSGFDVKTNAEFHGNLTVDGKITTPYLVDPPGLLLDSQTRTGIAQQAALSVPPDKQNGALLFFNQGTKRLEVYVASEGTFYDLAGNVVASQPLPTAQVTVGRRIWFDAVTGDVVTNQTVSPPRYQIRQGYQFDPADGQFYQLASGDASNSVPRVLVPKSEAITLTPETSSGAAPAN